MLVLLRYDVTPLDVFSFCHAAYFYRYMLTRRFRRAIFFAMLIFLPPTCFILRYAAAYYFSHYFATLSF